MNIAPNAHLPCAVPDLMPLFCMFLQIVIPSSKPM